jgi:16S rRNA processing protein RimM
MPLLDRDRLMRIGVVTGAHGMEGALRAAPETNDADYYRDRRELFVDSERGLQHFGVKNWRGAQGEWVIELEGLVTRGAAEAMRGAELLLDDATLRPLAENEYFQHDLAGCEVVTDTGQVLGRVKAILEIGPQQLLVVRDGKREHLLPMLGSVIEAVDLKARRIRVKPPPGLLELNA